MKTFSTYRKFRSNCIAFAFLCFNTVFAFQVVYGTPYIDSVETIYTVDIEVGDFEIVLIDSLSPPKLFVSDSNTFYIHDSSLISNFVILSKPLCTISRNSSNKKIRAKSSEITSAKRRTSLKVQSVIRPLNPKNDFFGGGSRSFLVLTSSYSNIFKRFLVINTPLALSKKERYSLSEISHGSYSIDSISDLQTLSSFFTRPP